MACGSVSVAVLYEPHLMHFFSGLMLPIPKSCWQMARARAFLRPADFSKLSCREQIVSAVTSSSHLPSEVDWNIWQIVARSGAFLPELCSQGWANDRPYVVEPA